MYVIEAHIKRFKQSWTPNNNQYNPELLRETLDKM